jgi:hypothetical protein
MSREDGVKYGKASRWMRISRLTDHQGRGTEDNSISVENPPLDDLEHHARRKERQAGEAQEKRVKLT